MKNTVWILVSGLIAAQVPPYAAEAAWVDNVPGHHRVWLKQVDPQYKTWTSDEERPWIGAQVRQVEAERGTVIITHGPLRKPPMKAMTMRLPLKDRVHLGMLKPGDVVQIQAADIGGRVTIVNLRMQH